ncbi:hypothetical protein Mkiyose1665_09480 [Mycobacterium kiyosense]|uniref:Uncharacterized protein n=1 Tax=Mycobacterium kiyosense TaxID=2871094 RepID=A0A9P3Q429_9MYCO|nr:hypothetical protein IWGMT90018_19730 [Mycobacterium kiyosense]BDE15171.1 hypothetical protein MKCMC460_40310 [Mycobacterium sp. 20KCMC460]GLB81654.1 hypothetical protein SRL2020028_09100 [Mycobacterium kiyosense]GLB87567.1 hypothetical protein SRL2020130_03840 [Mycobacterium kiyosense]GLB94234.1 hypothetical protein SRL2020226_10100 [Mycobacterium kiyosense]
MKGPTAAAISVEDGPIQPSSVRVAITEPYEAAAERISAAIVFHDELAPSIDADPGPAYMRAELISGGSAAKSIMTVS